MDKIILEAKNVNKSYSNGENRLNVLSNINLTLIEKEIITITGQSGCGKSTLLNILSTLDKPDKGEIKINGMEIVKLDSDEISLIRNTYVGFVFQFHHLLPDFTAFENINMPNMIGNDDYDENKTNEFIRFLNLDNIKHKYPSELSGGERQRVAVLRAIIRRPKILFADEPTGNLDEKNASLLVDLFKEINSNFDISIIITTHNPDVAQIGNRSYSLNKKKLIENNLENEKKLLENS